jgi:hypothetical protein
VEEERDSREEEKGKTRPIPIKSYSPKTPDSQEHNKREMALMQPSITEELVH